MFEPLEDLIDRGERLQFDGENRERQKGLPTYIILKDGKPLDGSAASGYARYIGQFKFICPERVSLPAFQ